MLRKLFMIVFVMGTLGLAAHQAVAEGKYSIKQMTPEVKAALDNRRSRFDQLQQLETSGAVGENNKGYVQVLNDVGGASAVASAENNDRKVIYQTIAQQNGLNGELGTIESVFAQVQSSKAHAGEKVQTESGSWITK